MLDQKVGPVFFQNQGQGRGQGVNAIRYIASVLGPPVLPFTGQIMNFRFQQDNARAHTAWVTQNLLRRHGIVLQAYPASQPGFESNRAFLR